MYRLTIQQCNVGNGLFKYYEYEFKNLIDNSILTKDSIDDTGQGIEEATKQIRKILRHKGYIK